MSQPVPVRGLFETHLTVSDLARSIDFYRDVVGLALAVEVPERGAAFGVALDDLLDAPRRLADHGVTPLSFFNAETQEPSVIGWMPAAAISLRDPDGHLLEYLSMLDDEPDAARGVVPWSEWIAGSSGEPALGGRSNVAPPVRSSRAV